MTMNILQRLKSAGGSGAGAAFAMGGALAVLFMSGAAVAITENTYNYTNAKNGYLGISNLGMVPNKAAGEYDNSPSAGLGTSIFKCFSRGINLPHGATIKNLIVFHRGFGEGDVQTNLLRHHISDGGRDTIGLGTSTTTTGLRVSLGVPIDPNFALVDNARYTYAFNICLNPGSVFFNARLGYSYTSAGD
jgi:hypothetical protein